MVDSWEAHKSCITQDRGASRLWNGWKYRYSDHSLYIIRHSTGCERSRSSGLAHPYSCRGPVRLSSDTAYRLAPLIWWRTATLAPRGIWYAGLIRLYVAADGRWERVEGCTHRGSVRGGLRGGSVVFYVDPSTPGSVDISSAWSCRLVLYTRDRSRGSSH